MEIQAFSHFGICVRDPERSMRFYCDLLGFERVSKLVVSNPDSARLVQLCSRTRWTNRRRAAGVSFASGCSLTWGAPLRPRDVLQPRCPQEALR